VVVATTGVVEKEEISPHPPLPQPEAEEVVEADDEVEEELEDS
jgi:hypothetical protein